MLAWANGPQGQSYGKLARASEATPRPVIAGRDLVSLVNALYNDFRSLFVGAIAASGTALITAYKSGEPVLYLCSLMIALVACARGWDVGRYQKCRARSSASMRPPMGAALRGGAAAHVFLMGVWCLLALHQDGGSLCAVLQLSR